MTELRREEKAGNLSIQAQQLVATEKPNESLFDLSQDPLEFNDLAKNPDYKEKLDELRKVHDQWMQEILDVGLIPEPILRDWEISENKPIYEILRENSDFYNDMLAISSTDEETMLYDGLNHRNEAVRYWAALGIYNLDQELQSNTVTLLKDKLKNYEVINVSISAARALLKHGFLSENVINKLYEGLSAENEWTRLQSALVIDDFDYAVQKLEKESKNLIKTDPNKYVVRVLNHAVNVLNGTENKVR
jgi:hypothetical protein